MIADDHLVFGWGNAMEEAWKEHDNNLSGLLERAKKIRLWFNSAKMRLRHEDVRYLGLLIPIDGLKPDQEKVAATLKMQKPTDIKSMQRFIGFVNYLAKFLPNLSTICEPLRLLSFIIAAPVLQFYDVTKEVTIQCDAGSLSLEQY